ncbi:MAG: hypothetical protein SOW59_00455 [Corynebacterium sp.]|nr:hypothetical protein [Corynebacterium sp.]
MEWLVRLGDAVMQPLVDAPMWIQLVTLIVICVPVMAALAWLLMYVIDFLARRLVPPAWEKQLDNNSD